MISEARLRANRRNAQRSTGPKTDAGKLRSRCNALTHGLTGRGEVLAADEAAAVERRAAEWAESLRPAGEHQRWLVRQAALASIRIDRCQELERARRGMDAARALACWEEQRLLEAEALGARLSAEPALVVAKLRRTPQGCDWLIVRWQMLGAVLDLIGGWMEGHRLQALDLLGEPTGAREADRALLASASPQELRSLIGAEVEALEGLKAEALDELDAAERALAESGLPGEEGADVRRIRRYEASCWRALRWAQQQLQSPDRPEAVEAAPVAEARPASASPAAPDAVPPACPARPGPPTARAEVRPTIALAPRADGRDPAAPASDAPPYLNRRARRALKKRARAG